MTRNQNLIEKLRLGTYSSHRMFFNPLTFRFSDYNKGKFTVNDYSGNDYLGSEELKLPKISNTYNKSLGESPSRLITAILDVGTLDQNVSTDINANPELYQSQSLMRYNILFTQVLNMTIPLNLSLRAGDMIECLFPKVSTAETKEYDEAQSGLYIIKELCHHFDVENSFTSLKLIRDTYGLK